MRRGVINQRRRRRGGLGTITFGDELITNGTFDTVTTGWTASTATLSIVNGKLRVTGTSSGLGRCDQSFTTVIGGTYRLTADAPSVPSSARFRIGTSAGGTQIANITPTGNVVYDFVATSTTTWLSLVDNSASVAIDYDNVSVKQILNI